MSKLRKGDRVAISYEGRDFEAIVVNPNGLGPDQPSVGFGFTMAERNVGIPQSTLSTWVHRENEEKLLKLPSGKHFRYIEMVGSDGKSYSVLEASDWFALAVDLLVNPGKTGKGLRTKLGDFIGWFAVKGFYAETYVALKGVYTAKDSRVTTQWLAARQQGTQARKNYTDLLQAEGCKSFEYANWTNRVYQGLFGLPAKEMKQQWELMAGDRSVARNYIPEAIALDAVRFCEDMVVKMFVDDLEEAHDNAIALTRRKHLPCW